MISPFVCHVKRCHRYKLNLWRSRMKVLPPAYPCLNLSVAPGLLIMKTLQSSGGAKRRGNTSFAQHQMELRISHSTQWQMWSRQAFHIYPCAWDGRSESLHSLLRGSCSEKLKSQMKPQTWQVLTCSSVESDVPWASLEAAPKLLEDGINRIVYQSGFYLCITEMERTSN